MIQKQNLQDFDHDMILLSLVTFTSAHLRKWPWWKTTPALWWDGTPGIASLARNYQLATVFLGPSTESCTFLLSGKSGFLDSCKWGKFNYSKFPQICPWKTLGSPLNMILNSRPGVCHCKKKMGFDNIDQPGWTGGKEAGFRSTATAPAHPLCDTVAVARPAHWTSLDMTGQCRAWTTKSMCDPSWVMSVETCVLTRFSKKIHPRWSPHWLGRFFSACQRLGPGEVDRSERQVPVIWVVSHTARHRYFRDKLSGHNHHNPLTLGWWAYNLDSPRISVRNSQDLSAIFLFSKTEWHVSCAS